MHILGLVEPLGTSILVSCSPESSCLSRTHMWRAAPCHHRLLGWDWGEGRGGAGSLAGEQGHQGGTQEAAWQSESRRAEPAPLVQEGAGTLTVSPLGAEVPATPQAERRRLHPESPDASAWFCSGEGSLLEGWGWPSAVLDVPNVPEWRLVQEAVHLLQTLCLADLLQAHLQGLGQAHEIPLHLLAGLQLGLQPHHLCPLF